MAILAAVSFVLIASLLVFNASDYDGEGSDDTTNKWSEANAIIFFNNQESDYQEFMQNWKEHIIRIMQNLISL